VGGKGGKKKVRLYKGNGRFLSTELKNVYRKKKKKGGPVEQQLSATVDCKSLKNERYDKKRNPSASRREVKLLSCIGGGLKLKGKKHQKRIHRTVSEKKGNELNKNLSLENQRTRVPAS